ncbi:MAG TPA: TMEM165/GDT1 family protein [Accumulibacter sp.]|nr:TMEM165/GDT1 family protein [Accumulibacter sp.]
MSDLQNFADHLSSLLANTNSIDISAAALTSFTLIVVAEIGDKSQLVCMTLASRHRPMPVLLGALTAFAALNTLAVVFGTAVASWLPEYVVSAVVALLFAAFGLKVLHTTEEKEDEDVTTKSSRGIFLTTFMLLTVAEFGDKTQLAVAALSSTHTPIGVWLGATVALALTSALGILAGRTILQKIPLALLHRISGAFFLILALFAAYQAYRSFMGFA